MCSFGLDFKVYAFRIAIRRHLVWHFHSGRPRLAAPLRAHSMPRSRCSSRSCQTVLPEQEQTVLSSGFSLAGFLDKIENSHVRGKEKHLLSQTPALLAITPTSVSGSFLSNCRESAYSLHIHRNLTYLSFLLSRNHNASTYHLPDVDGSV
jgi:hypothetical protein